MALRTSNDFDASSMASLDHVLVLSAISSFRRQGVRYRLIISPPLCAGNVFLGRTGLNEAITYRSTISTTERGSLYRFDDLLTCWAYEAGALGRNAVPIPLEHLDNNIWKY